MNILTSIQEVQWKKLVIATLPTLLFYGVSIAAIYLLDKWSLGGPCVPGLGALGFLFLLPGIFMLFFKNLTQVLSGNKNYSGRLAVHTLVCVWIVFSFFC